MTLKAKWFCQSCGRSRLVTATYIPLYVCDSCGGTMRHRKPSRGGSDE